MKESPIIMSTPMVQAILDGRKTMTRRIFKDHPILASDLSKIDLKQWFQDYKDYIRSFSPYGGVGDILYVRESFAIVTSKIQTHPVKIFKANYPDSIDELTQYMQINDCKWKPSIHMPKEAARIWLQIVSINPKRLHDISDADIVAEGVRIPVNGIGTGKVLLALGEKNTAIDFLPAGCLAPDAPKLTQSQLLHAFWAELWCKVNGRESWDKNPWVWAIEFKVISTTGREAEIK